MGELQLKIQNLQIEKIIIHEILQKEKDKNIQPPNYAKELSELDKNGKNTLRVRILNAIGEGSNALEMDIINNEEGSCVSIIDKILSSEDDKKFIENSKSVALKLSEAQNNVKIPGGIVVILKGNFWGGDEFKKYVCIIKAEIHNGFTRSDKNELQYISELLLTPQQKLYKIAFFIKENNQEQNLSKKYKMYIYDNNMRKVDTSEAAKYFYESFLGSGFKKDSKLMTKQFYDETKKFINQLDVSDEKKIELNTHLHSYVSSTVRATISTVNFADEYLEETYSDNYTNYMKSKGITDKAFSLNKTYIEKSLSKRKIFFTNNIGLTAPSENFAEDIKVINKESDIIFEEGRTILSIRGKIKKQV